MIFAQNPSENEWANKTKQNNMIQQPQQQQ